MKQIKFSEGTKTWMLSSFIVIVASILSYEVIHNFKGFKEIFQKSLTMLSPFFWGIAFAFLMLKPMTFIEGFLRKNGSKRQEKQSTKSTSKKDTNIKTDSFYRNMAVFLTVILALVILGAIFAVIIPQLVNSIAQLSKSISGYVGDGSKFLRLTNSKWLGENFSKVLISKSEEYFAKFSGYLSQALPIVGGYLIAFSGKIANVLMGFIVAIYLLSGKEQFSGQIKKIGHAYLEEKTLIKAKEVVDMVYDVFSKYVVGQLLDAVAVGVLCFALMSVFRIPFAPLVSMLVAITNVIPMVGPFIGAIPSAFIIATTSPTKALVFLLIILIIQQIDGNILAPKIVGNSTGLTGFWVLFAIYIGGSLFGIIGIVLAVPVMAVCYRLIKMTVENRLREKNWPIDTDQYV